MKIGIYGAYGQGDYCDDFIEVAIKKEFSKHVKAEFVRVYNREAECGDLDMVVMGGGSLFGLPMSGLKRLLERQKDCPFVIMGTGFRDIQPPFNLRYLWDRASKICVRGESTLHRLGEFGLDKSKVEFCAAPIFLREKENFGKGCYIGGVVREKGSRGMVEGFKKISEFTGKKVKLFAFCEQQGDLTGGVEGFSFVRGSLEEVYKGLCMSDFWYGNRLHAYCLALINEIPTIGVEIEFSKILDVNTVINYPYWFTFSDAYNNKDKTIRLYHDLEKNWSKHNDKVQVKIKEVRANLRRFVKECVELID